VNAHFKFSIRQNHKLLPGFQEIKEYSLLLNPYVRSFTVLSYVDKALKVQHPAGSLPYSSMPISYSISSTENQKDFPFMNTQARCKNSSSF